MKIVKRGQDARDALKRGIDLVADSIKITLGPSGRNAILGRIDLPPKITNDGATIALNIEAEDEFENLGVMAVKEATALTDAKAGDGTTTTTVFLQKMVETLFELIKDNGSLISKKVDTIKLKKELDALCEKVVARLKEKSRPITKKDIYDVAIVSGEYEWLAEMVAKVFEKVGADGFVSIEEANKNDYEVFPGIELHSGASSDYFLEGEDQQCVLEKPYILVTNNKLEIYPIVNLLESFPKDQDENKEISVILIAPDFTLDLVKRMIATKVQFGINLIPIKLPTYDKDDVLVDISTLTEATFLDKNTILKPEDFVKAVNFGQLGQVQKAIITDAKTILIGGNGDTKARIKEIKKLREKSQSEFDKHRMNERIAHLSGGFAKIRIGGTSDTERNYFKLKAEDAVNAVREALREGVIPGGGLTFKEIAEELGETIISPALLAPYNQIQENHGSAFPIEPNVIDPLTTAISALRSAVSLAGIIITTEVAVAHKNEPKREN